MSESMRTTDHRVIRRSAKARDDEHLEQISWDELFEEFEQKQLIARERGRRWKPSSRKSM